MRDEIDARRHQAPGRRAAGFGATHQRGGAEIEAVRAVDAPRDQARIGARQILGVVEFALAEAGFGADVAQSAIMGFDTLDDEAAAAAADLVARPELGALQRRGVCRVGAQRAGRGEYDLHGAAFDAQDRAQAKLRFGQGDPTLSGREGHNVILTASA